MDNQHRRIAGYRELTADEIEMMNRAKVLEQQCLDLIAQQANFLSDQAEAAELAADDDEQARLREAQPGRWLSIGRTHIQEGFMAIVRSIAQPGPAKLPDPD